jgi:hypothetical protein
MDVRKRESNLRKNPDWIEKERKRGREKYYRLNYKDKNKPSTEKKREIMERYSDKYPEKYEAAKKCTHMTKIEGYNMHHWSYNYIHYKDVINLTIKEHNIVHRYMIYDQERKMYRSGLSISGIVSSNKTRKELLFIQNELLDTKKRHLDFCELILNTYN